jgi:hypothetical protein
MNKKIKNKKSSCIQKRKRKKEKASTRLKNLEGIIQTCSMAF